MTILGASSVQERFRMSKVLENVQPQEEEAGRE